MSYVRLGLLLVLAAACNEKIVGPLTPVPASREVQAASADQGPPPPHTFGRDSVGTGTFTGQGTTQPGLSCTTNETTAIRECTGYLASAVDGTLLDVTLDLPTTAATPTPLVVLIHGYAGSKNSSGDQVQPLLAEGYGVLRYSTRGFGDSWGQVNMVDVHAEVADMRSMIAQVVDDTSFHLNPDAVAVTGASYGGGHSWLAALQPTFSTPGGNRVRIRTIVPIAAWSDLLYGLIPNGRERESIDRPGGAKLSYINGLYVSGFRQENSSRPYSNYPDYFIAWHAWINAQEPNDLDPIYRGVVDGLAGYRSIWWQQAFWTQVAATHIPVFTVQGFTDDLFPMSEAKRMILALQTVDPTYPVAAYFGDIGHPRASNKTGEVDYVLGLVKTWLAYYLKGVGSAPPNVVYAALTRPREEPFNAANVITVPTLGALSTSTVSRQFGTTTTVLVNPATDPLSGFFWDPLVMTGAEELKPLPVPPESPLVPGSLATYEVKVKKLSGGGPLTIAGQPTVTLHAFTAAYRVQLNVRLFDVDGAGAKRLVTRGTYTLQSAGEGVTIGDVDVTIPTYGNLWRAEADHTLRLELTNVDSPYLTPSRVPSATTVTSVRLDVPVR
jgi:ABC-2 type transport system ATP-binding protein